MRWKKRCQCHWPLQKECIVSEECCFSILTFLFVSLQAHNTNNLNAHVKFLISFPLAINGSSTRRITFNISLSKWIIQMRSYLNPLIIPILLENCIKHNAFIRITDSIFSIINQYFHSRITNNYWDSVCLTLAHITIDALRVIFNIDQEAKCGILFNLDKWVNICLSL